MINFRTLQPNEIQVRVGSVTQKGATFLLYKDARCDMNMLDETVGVENWQREHSCIDGTIYCRVGINVNFRNPDAAPVWVWKQDAGSESNMEAEKGASSSSFKRACVNWGLGRELYSSPFIFIPLETVQRGNKWELKNKFVKFFVAAIEYNAQRDIIALVIADENGEVAFSYPNNNRSDMYKKQPTAEKQTYTEPAHDSAKQDSGKPFCTICGKEISEHKAGGKTYSVDELVKRSMQKHHKVICIDCAKVLGHEN